MKRIHSLLLLSILLLLSCRSSDEGRRIKFENTTLPTIVEGQEEEIITDWSKQNLVVFTASWCAPCVEEIPLLKEIHVDLHDNLNLVFVSFDVEKTLPAFKQLIREEEIPWRSLLAYKQLEAMEKKYGVEGLPHAILVDKKGRGEALDVRRDDHRAKLYERAIGR